MINIINPERKHEIRAARINVALMRYVFMLMSLAVLIAAIYGVGFWLVIQDEQATKDKLQSQTEQSKAYAAVEKEADIFRKNLVIAKSILGSETSYSSFLTTLGGDVPDGTIITNLSLGRQTPAQLKNGMEIVARAASYAKVLELKSRLEQSELFDDVSIISTSRPDEIAALTGLEAKYPYEASLNVKLSPARQAKVVR